MSVNVNDWKKCRAAYLSTVDEKSPQKRKQALQHFGKLVLIALKVLKVPADARSKNMPFLWPFHTQPPYSTDPADLAGAYYVALGACNPNNPLRQILITRDAIVGTVYYTASAIRHELMHGEDGAVSRKKFNSRLKSVPRPGKTCITKHGNSSTSGACCRPDQPGARGDCEGRWCKYVEDLIAFYRADLDPSRHLEIFLGSIVSFEKWSETEQNRHLVETFSFIQTEARKLKAGDEKADLRAIVGTSSPVTLAKLFAIMSDTAREKTAKLFVGELVGHLDILNGAEREEWKQLYLHLLREWLRASSNLESKQDLERLSKNFAAKILGLEK